MKTSKLLITSLLAAAAMSVPAWAATYSDGAVHTVDSSETGDLIVNGGSTVNIVDTASTVTLSSIKHSGGNAAATVNVGAGTGATTVVTTRVEMGDANADVTSALSVLSGSTLVITGNDNGENYKNASLLLGEWGAKTTLTVSGMMLAQSASALAGDSGMALNVSGGTLAVNGIGTGKTSGKSPASSLNISGGGKLILGSDGISHLLGTWSSNLGEGTIGLSAAETTIANALNFTDSITGTTFDTTQYAFSGEGAAQTISRGTTGGTIKITGTLSGSGIVKVAGSGILDLSGATVSLSSAIQNSATVTVNSNTIFVLSDSLKVGDTGNTYSLISGNTSGITDWSTLTASNFRIGSGPNSLRGASADVSAAGQVVFTAGAAANLTWKAGASGTWDVQTTQSWTNDSTSADDIFYDYDNVTFATTGDVTVSVGSAVTAGTVNISAGTVMFTGEKVTAQDGFQIGGTGILKLGAADDILGTVTVNEGGKFELNGKTENLGANGISVVLNGGTLSNAVAVAENKRQLYGLTLTADSTVEAGGRFGLVGANYAAVALDLGGHTLTKTGNAAFVLVNTTVKNGTLSVTEGGVTDSDNGANRGISLTQGAAISVSESGSVNLKITSMGDGTSLTLAGTTASTVTISGAVAAGANIEVSNGNSVTFTAGNNNGNGTFSGNLKISGAGATFTQAGDAGCDQLARATANTIEISNGGTLDLGANRWTVTSNHFILDGGNITGTGQVAVAATETNPAKYYGVLDFNGSNFTFVVKNTYGMESTISGPVRLNSATTFDVQSNAVLNITGRLANSSALQKSGSGTLVLDLADDAVETNEAFSGAVTLSEGKIVLKYSSALGTGTVTAAGSTGVNEVTLKVAEDSSGNALTVGNAISVSAGKTLILESANVGNKLTGVIFESGALKLTSGTLTLSGHNTYSGGTTIEGGVLKVDSLGYGDKGNLGQKFTQDGTVLKNGGVLEVTAAQNAIATGDEYGDGGALRGFSVTAGEGTYRYTGTETSYIAPNINGGSLQANSHIGIADDATLIFDVTQGDATLDVSKVIANTTDTGTDTTTGALKKIGAGTLTLSGNNTYAGGTVIEAGMVVAANASALGTTKGVEVQSGAALNLGASAVTVAGLSGAGTVGLADGTDSATLTVNGGGVFTGTLSGGTNSLALVFDADGQTLALNPAVSNTLSSVDVRAGTVKTGSAFGLGYSQVSVQSSGTLEFTASKTNDYGLMLGGITFADGSSFVVDVTGAEENDVLKIIMSSAIKYNTGTEELTLGVDGNLDDFVNDFVTLKGWDGLADWSYAGDTLSVTLTVPEPSAFGLLAGAGALALVAARRRRTKKA